MTEQEWLTCGDSKAMLVSLGKQAEGRKVRLFNCACCRRILPLLRDEEIRKALAAAERYSDSHIKYRAARNWYRRAKKAAQGLSETPECFPIKEAYRVVAMLLEPYIIYNHFQTDAGVCAIAGWNKSQHMNSDEWRTAAAIEARSICNLIRDVFGNPFRPVPFDSAWRTENVLAVAKSIYDERRFSEMSILADALEDAGCTSADILDHCRNPGEHVLGCWVVDLVLAKE